VACIVEEGGPGILPAYDPHVHALGARRPGSGRLPSSGSLCEGAPGRLTAKAGTAGASRGPQALSLNIYTPHG
jgi:hypothetical protein